MSLSSFATFARAATSSGITYQGRILKPDGSPLEGQIVQFRMQLRSPDSGSCLMYEELQQLDMRGSKGLFGITINDGSGTRTDTSGYNLDRIFANKGSFTFLPSDCTAGASYAPNPSDGRVIQVYFKDETMSAWEPMPPQALNFVPLAIEAKQVAGFGPQALLRFDLPVGSPKNSSPLSEAEYDKLVSLLAGTSTDYERAGRLGGVALPSTGSFTAGQVLSWNGSAWAASDSVANDAVTTVKILDAAVTSAKIADGTIAGADLAANIAITTTGSITSTGAISTSGTLSSNVATSRDFRIYDSDVAPNENYVSIKVPASLSQNYNYIWPINYGTSNQVLTTDGAGTLTWAAAATSSQWVDGAAGAISYSGGNVGIGVANPAYKLTVVGNDSSGIVNVVSNADTGYNTGFSVFAPNLSNSNSIQFKIGKAPTGNQAAEFNYRYGSGGTSVFSLGMYGSPSIINYTDAQRVGIGVTAPTAAFHLKAGAATASNAPLKFSSSGSGVLLTTPEDGAMEYDGTGLFFTIGTTRYLIPTNTSAGNYSNVSTISNSSGSIVLSPMAGSGSVQVTSGAASTSSTSGALIVTGGAGISGALNTGGNIAAGGNISATGTVTATGAISAGGNLTVNNAVTTAATQLVLEQTGDSLGTTRLRLQNRNGANGAIFENPSLDLVDFGFQPSSGATSLSSLRLERRAAQKIGSSNASEFQFINTGSGSTTPWFASGATTTVFESGNVGIGVRAPAAKLDVSRATAGAVAQFGTAAGDSSVTVNAPAGSAASVSLGRPITGGKRWDLSVTNTAEAGSNGGSDFGISRYSDAGALISTPLMIQRSNGRVGVGTSTPDNQLHVVGGIHATQNSHFDGDISFGANVYGPVGSFGSGGNSQYSPTSTTQENPGQTFLQIANSWLVDNNYSGMRFSAANSSNVRQSVYAGMITNAGASNYTPTYVIGHKTGVTSYVERFRIDSTGNIGLGVTSPSEALDVNGSVRAVSFISTSDERLKKNIVKSPGLDFVLKLTGVQWQWKSDNRTDAGTIAQEVERVMPFAVVTDAKSGYKAVKYNALIAPLIESTKEIYGMFREQNDSIKKLSSELNDVQSELRDVKLENAQLKRDMDLIKKKLGL